MATASGRPALSLVSSSRRASMTSCSACRELLLPAVRQVCRELAICLRLVSTRLFRLKQTGRLVLVAITRNCAILQRHSGTEARLGRT
jgi:hypothetical protein